MALVNSGATSNFMHSKAVEYLKLQLVNMPVIWVALAGGSWVEYYKAVMMLMKVGSPPNSQDAAAIE